MIKSVDIENFGSFRDFAWKSRIKNKKGEVGDFKKLNILYGRNYSGKTTLSRLFRCLETGELPPKYENPDFMIKTDSGNISPTGIISHSHHVRVFNRDFVNDHLSFLRDDGGKIEPFAVLGGDNTKIEKEIAGKEKLLGSVENTTGLRYDYAQKQTKWEQKKTDLEKAESRRTKLLTDEARKLKQNPEMHGDVNYNINKIKTDINTIKTQGIAPLSNDDEEQNRQLLKQESLPEISSLDEPNLQLHALYIEAKVLLGKEIRPTKPIQDLLDDAMLQVWAKEGMPLHRDKRKTCGFCGNLIPDDLWEKLDQHFSKESQDLDSQLIDLIERIEKEKKRVQKLLLVKKADLYIDLQAKFETIEFAIEEKLEVYRSELDRITGCLRNRKADLFKTRELAAYQKVDYEIENFFKEINSLIGRNAQMTGELATLQSTAREKLRLSEVSSFIKTIDLPQIDADIVRLKSEGSDLESEAASAEKLVTEQEQAIENLKKKLSDERQGAEKVNQYLSHHFGHDSLKLVAVEAAEEETGVQFEVWRGAGKAFNLSDGECSLIAFCYFIAKLGGSESDGKDLIIYIDDPVSSLDSDHIFFVFSLIQGVIASPVKGSDGAEADRYKQLFVSTHNLDFLKYLKRLSRPKAGGNEQFVLSRTENGSLLELMPSYLRNYVTEFHYLFDQICACADASEIAEDQHCFFNFGNNLRKFLEIYLFFKFPLCENANNDYNRRIGRFFDDDPAVEPMVVRITNELSHGGERFDRSVRPIEPAEISKMAIYVLAKVRDQDRVQYCDLLEATQRTDPLPST